MSDLNPYAPPATDESSPQPAARTKTKRGRGDLQAAIEALEEHLSKPANVAADLKAAGGRLRTVSGVLIALGLGGLLIAAALSSDSRKAGPILAVTFGAILLLLGLVGATFDLQMVSRKAPAPPAATLKSHLRAFALGRYGYAWACLCPTARARSVTAPSLGPVASGIGTFSMENEAGLRAYASTFARPGGGNVRSFQVKNLTVASQDEGVAVVEAQLLFQSWPRWTTVLLWMGGAMGWRAGNATGAPIGLLGLLAAAVGFIAMLALRKHHRVSVQRTLILGKNGVWYVFDPDILEGSSAGG
jgi:hypothetical protein